MSAISEETLFPEEPLDGICNNVFVGTDAVAQEELNDILLQNMGIDLIGDDSWQQNHVNQVAYLFPGTEALDLWCRVCGEQFVDQDLFTEHQAVHRPQFTEMTRTSDGKILLWAPDEGSGSDYWESEVKEVMQDHENHLLMDQASQIEESQDEIITSAIETFKRTVENFNSPKKRETIMNPTPCPRCEKVLANPRNMRRHLRSGACQEKCNTCGMFMSSKLYLRHAAICLKAHPSVPKLILQCKRTPKDSSGSATVENWAPKKKTRARANSIAEELETPVKKKKRFYLEKIVRESSGDHKSFKEYLKSLPGYVTNTFSRLQCFQCKKEFDNFAYCQHVPCDGNGKRKASNFSPPTTLQEVSKRFSIFAVCRPCGARFSDLKAMEQHDPYRCENLMDYVHKNVKLKSVQEESALKAIVTLTLHRLKSEDIEMCRGKLVVKKEKHIKKRNPIVQCDECKTFLKKTSLPFHLENESCLCTCPTCYIKCTKSSYNRHCLKAHGFVKPDIDGISRYACACGKDFERKKRMEMHAKHCKQHKCPVCGQSFNMNCSMLKHARKCAVRMPSAGNDFTCPWCGASFVSRWQFVRHCTVAHNITGRLCKLCGREFPSETAIDEHFFNLKLGIGCAGS